MHIKQQIDIRATPGQVWPFLVDPVIQAAWNPKIISIDRDSDGPVTVGETFTLLTKMSRKESTSQAEVIEVAAEERLVFRHRVSEQGRDVTVAETYVLKPKDRGTRVMHAIDLSQSGIPKLLLLLITFVSRLGRSVGEPYLDKLKQMIEAEVG